MSSPASASVLILRDKLDSITRQRADVVKALDLLGQHITEAEKMISEFASSTIQPIIATIKIATYLDCLEEKLLICQNALASLNDSDLLSPSGFSQNENSTENINSRYQESTSSTLAIFKAQLEELQQQMVTLQRENKKDLVHKIENIETEIFLMKENHQPLTAVHQRLQNVEVKQLLIDEIQTKNSVIIREVKAEMKSDLNRVTALQVDLARKVQKVLEDNNALMKLRDLLNQMNERVASRAELATNVEHLLQEVQNIQEEIRSMGSNHDDVMPAFLANIPSSTIVQPGKKVIFSNAILNKWGCYETKEGIFETLVEGIYYFCVSVNIDSDGALCLSIIHNNHDVAQCATPDKRDTQTSTSAVLELKIGDRVWVESSIQSDIHGVKLGSGYSNFLGFRVI